jgi:predicted nuclease of predicted toxin-antitoxin system
MLAPSFPAARLKTMALRILANENFPGPVIQFLRASGHDVASVKESMRGASDADVLAAAQVQGRLVVTFDKDFGELAFRSLLPSTCGVVLFRLNGDSPAADNARAIAVLTSREDWSGHFAVVTDDRLRMRPLPGT